MQTYHLNILIGLITSTVGLGLVEDNFLLVVDTNNRTIHQIDLSDGSIGILPLAEMNYPVAVEFNPTDRKLYWTDLRENIIRSSYLNGTDEKTITTLHKGSFLVGLAIDMVSGLVYYTEGGADIIAVMTLEGRYHFTLITEDMDEPQDIVLDLERGMMYWSDKGQAPRIERATMDGRERSLVISFEDLAVPLGLAIDNTGNRLYWCDAYLDTIQSVSLADKEKKTVVHVNLPGTQHFGIVLLADNLYFTGIRKSYVSKITLSDSPPTPAQVGPAGFNMSSGITAYRRTRLTNGFEANSTCSIRNGGCEQVCLATPDGPQCACQNGFIAGKTCSTPTYQCPLEYSGRTGHIRSPGYPIYGNNVYCMMTLRMNNVEHHKRVIRFYVEDYDLAHKHDYLLIQNNKVTGSVIRRYGTFSVETTQEDLIWLFVTDGSVVGRGFHFKYEVFNVVHCNATRLCQNGATCVNGEFCKCQYGYEGAWCDKDVDDCASNPCRNGGTCVNKHNGFRCTCASLFTGTVCETDMDSCRSHPCMNGGSCRNQFQTGTFRCDCTDSFTGDVCDSPILCKMKPCQNGGICSQQGDVRTCNCVGSFSGVNCELSLMATVPDSEKKRLDVTLKLKDAKFKPGLKDTDSEEYQRLRNNVEDALKTIIDDKVGKGRYDIIDVTFSAGSVVVNYVIEMLNNAASTSTILAAIKGHHGLFAGHELDANSVDVSERANSAADSPEKKPVFSTTIIVIISGTVVGIIAIGFATGCCISKKQRSRAAQQEAENPAFTVIQRGLTADGPGDTGNVYAHLQSNPACESPHVYGQLHHNRSHERPNPYMHFSNASYSAGEETGNSYQTICHP